jgi:hypothetical protein
MAVFNFEQDFADSLRCIPMQIRYNLDACGVKLSLAQWHQLSLRQRQQLLDMPCATSAELQAYRHCLDRWLLTQTGTPVVDLSPDKQATWVIATTASELPQDLATKATQHGVHISKEQWQQLTALQRFALLKLSRSGHESHNFLPALVEFGLRSEDVSGDS